MKLNGKVFTREGTDEDFDVKEAIVTARRISVDWEERGKLGHLEAESADGISFRGHYGYPVPRRDYFFRMRLFRAKGEFLLLGTYSERDTGSEGMWFFQLPHDGGKKNAKRK
ncbi:MAG: hypothetical protein HY000_39405 [Planctomycetes bacterium]|nr:hypothetical protein [Planctomycetota bacterium]